MQENTEVKTETQTLAETEKPVKKNIFGKPRKEQPKKSLAREILEWVGVIVTAVVMAFIIRTFVGEMVSVDGNSMYATLHNREVMIVEKTHYSTAVVPFVGNFPIGGQPERFDVVICHYPGRGNTNFVKRVVGLPGDQIAVEPEVNANGKAYGVLYVNGERYDEPYLINRIDYYLADYWDTRSIRFTKDNPYTVPEGMYFVLGDNRSNSNDSHILGPISRNMIMGHVCYVILPWGDHRPIPNGLEDNLPRRLEEGL